MKESKPLTKTERAWLKKFQELLDACPSERLGFYTTGDTSVTVYDLTQIDAIYSLLDEKDNRDFCSVSLELGADLSYLNFPSDVLSTAG